MTVADSRYQLLKKESGLQDKEPVKRLQKKRNLV